MFPREGFLVHLILPLDGMNVKSGSTSGEVSRTFLLFSLGIIRMWSRPDVSELSLMGIPGVPGGVASLSADVDCGGKQ